MKKHYKIAFLFLLIPFLGFSNDDTFISKQKSIKKTYIVNSNAGIDIDNKYGNISVSTWDEDKIDLDITIKVTGGNEKWVDEKLNSIDVNITALKSMVTAVTQIGNSSMKSKGSSNSFEINYVIKIPKSGSVKLMNKYGNISTLTIEGATNIACKYGKVTLGKLNNASNRLQIDYCQNSSIDFVKSATIEARYSGLKINDSGNVTLDANYTDVTVGQAQNIKYESNYGNLKFEKVNSITGAGNYLTIGVSELSNSLNIDATYSKLSVSTITSSASNITISTGYTDVSLGYDPNYAFDFDINTRYGGIKADNSLDISVSETKNTSKRISGTNKKKGQNSININSNYGNVTLIKK